MVEKIQGKCDKKGEGNAEGCGKHKCGENEVKLNMNWKKRKKKEETKSN
jgi:hypothetical protein